MREEFTQFWFECVLHEGEPNEEIKIEIDYNKLLAFLQEQGFGLLISGTERKTAEIVRVQANIVSKTIEQHNSNITVKQFVLDFLARIKRFDVREIILRRQGTFFSLNFLTAMRPLTLTFARDTRTESVFCFQNGCLAIAAPSGGQVISTFQSYEARGVHVWDTQIQPRAYLGRHHPDHRDRAAADCEFARFLTCVSQEWEAGELRADNLFAFVYALCYLLHTAKDIARAFAVLAVDNTVSDSTKGRRGKTIFALAVELFRKLTYEDGKTVRTDSVFMFQTIEADSQVVLFDDVRRDFDFEQFYPTITGPCMREQKGKGRVKTAFHDAPKFIFTSNRPILGDGDSDVARWFILPFTAYFSLRHTPFDEFGHRLFDDWDDEEWARFFDWVADSMARYLAYSNCPLYKKPEADLTTYHAEKLKVIVASELVDYLDTYLNVLPYEIPKKLFFDDFKGLYPIYQERTQHWFSAKLAAYCQVKGILINPGCTENRLFITSLSSGERVEYLRFVAAKGA